MTMNDIRSYYHFENRVGDAGNVSKVLHHLVVTFKEKSTKLKLLNTKRETNRSVRYSQLIVQPMKQGQNDPMVHFHNRLTKFNLNMEKQLHRLLSQGIIGEFQLNGLFHEFRHNMSSTWILVSHPEVLSSLNNLLQPNQISYTKRLKE